MPKEAKAKGERKKRAKKGIFPHQLPSEFPIGVEVNNALTTYTIDPNAPKRGLSAYMFFAQVRIPQL